MTPDIVLPDFETFAGQTYKGLDQPEEATAATQALLTGDREGEQPRIDAPGDNQVTLERGINRDGTWYRDAEVRELTGSDEEAIAAAGVGSSPYRVFETVLMRGVVAIGGEPMTRKVAGELLIGDRELLIMAIRRASFGENLEFERLPCPHCEELVDLTVPLSAIPFTHLDDPERVEFEVFLRKGATGVVRLPNGADQEAVFGIKGNPARQDSEILGRCVLRVVLADGTEIRRPPAQTLSMADRQTLLRHLADLQPGPRYGDMSFAHDACGEEVPLPISLATLFRGL
ncbi:T4 family baseplate hub assembly chaperone [Actinacidiphila glaucinigra]|uniref:T4 family baseplate hub assembly chaperone n=1 Tax=Actinacidiphila glaucinigra TaxID=235986 RepID=UPI00366BFDEC